MAHRGDSSEIRVGRQDPASDRSPSDEQAGADEQTVANGQPAEDADREEQRQTPGTILSIEDLVGAKVVTRKGESRGTVVDVMIDPPPELRVRGLIVGNWSWLERLRIAVRLRDAIPEAARLQEIRWDAVERWDGLRIVLYDDPPVGEIELEPGPTGELAPGKPLEPQDSEDPERD
jgi:sporulation protein YlmC with PRC-barrel domain